MVSHIEYGLLSLVHGSGRWPHGIARGHAAAEGHGLGRAPTSLGLERRAEDCGRGTRRTDGAIGRHAGVGTRYKYGMLRRRGAVLRPVGRGLSAGLAVHGPDRTRTARPTRACRCAELHGRRCAVAG